MSLSLPTTGIQKAEIRHSLDATQPPVYDSEKQRKEIATIVYNFVTDIKTKNPDANVVSFGDFNDYPIHRCLKIHEGDI